MAHIKLSLRFNPGRSGSPMGKFGEFATQTEKFLRNLLSDFGENQKVAKWIARNFTNESVAFDSEYSETVPESVAVKARRAMYTLSGGDPLRACSEGLVSFPTVAEFSKIGKSLDKDEHFLLGLYERGSSEPNWQEITYMKTAEIRVF